MFYCFHRTIYEQLTLDPGYFNHVIDYAIKSDDDATLAKEPRFRPMAGIQRSRDTQGPIPVNPSDSNVFRLHQLLQGLHDQPPTADEVRRYLS